MKNKSTLLLLATTLFFTQCKKTSADSEENTITTAQTNVQTLQVVQLLSPSSLDEKYEAKFGDRTVELIRSSDSTLVFMIPDVITGQHELRSPLGVIQFNVSQPALTDAAALTSDVFDQFDDRVAAFSPANQEEVAAVNELKQFRNEVETLVSSLTPAQKVAMANFYEANKANFKTFSADTHLNLDASTTMRQQSTCPTTNFQEFYGCTASNLANASLDFGKALADMSSFAGLGFIAAASSPASFGLGAGAAALAYTAAAYILIMEVKPAAIILYESAGPFLKANWLLGKGLFLLAKDKFNSESVVDLNIKPVFRTLEETDASVNAGVGSFIPSFLKLTAPWNKFKVLVGSMPSFVKTEKPATIETADLEITGISNPNVQLVSQVDGQVKFKSLSGAEEKFTYKAKFSKQGFTETADLTGTVTISSFKIGDMHAGGKIFHLDASGQHGYVVSEELGRLKWDSSRGANGITYTALPIGGLGISMGTGKANTAKIIDAVGQPAIAARACKAYRGGGFDDWFLPSLDEVITMYDNLQLSFGFYWSSSETTQNGGQVYASTYGWSANHQANRVSFDAKSNDYRVVAIRAF